MAANGDTARNVTAVFAQEPQRDKWISGEIDQPSGCAVVAQTREDLPVAEMLRVVRSDLAGLSQHEPFLLRHLIGSQADAAHLRLESP
jgi:hypothetical protein